MEVELRLNNLYQNGVVSVFANGEMLLDRPLVEFKGTLTDDYHPYKNGQQLDWVAYRYYKEIVPDPSKFWWLVADGNNIQNPLDLEEYSEIELLVPNITKALLRLTNE